jgi:hypothetical protein
VLRAYSDEKRKYVGLLLTTPKHPHGIQVYATKTGQVRVFSEGGEWTPPKTKEV